MSTFQCGKGNSFLLCRENCIIYLVFAKTFIMTFVSLLSANIFAQNFTSLWEIFSTALWMFLSPRGNKREKNCRDFYQKLSLKAFCCWLFRNIATEFKFYVYVFSIPVCHLHNKGRCYFSFFETKFSVQFKLQSALNISLISIRTIKERSKRRRKSCMIL